MERIKSASLMTAIKTPYTSDGEIDLDTFDQLVEAQISAGVEGLIIAGRRFVVLVDVDRLARSSGLEVEL